MLFGFPRFEWLVQQKQHETATIVLRMPAVMLLHAQTASVLNGNSCSSLQKDKENPTELVNGNKFM